MAADWLIHSLTCQVGQFCLATEFLKIEQKLAIQDRDENFFPMPYCLNLFQTLVNLYGLSL